MSRRPTASKASWRRAIAFVQVATINPAAQFFTSVGLAEAPRRPDQFEAAADRAGCRRAKVRPGLCRLTFASPQLLGADIGGLIGGGPPHTNVRRGSAMHCQGLEPSRCRPQRHFCRGALRRRLVLSLIHISAPTRLGM